MMQRKYVSKNLYIDKARQRIIIIIIIITDLYSTFRSEDTEALDEGSASR